MFEDITAVYTGLTEVITFFPRLHLPICVHPVLSDVDQDFTFEVPDADISHLSNLEEAKSQSAVALSQVSSLKRFFGGIFQTDGLRDLTMAFTVLSSEYAIHTKNEGTILKFLT